MAMASVAIGLIALLDVSTQRALEICAMIIFSIGFGGAIQNCTLSARMSVTPDYMTIATASISFFQIIGGVIVGLTIEGALFNNRLSSLLQQTLLMAVSRKRSYNPLSLRVVLPNHLEMQLYMLCRGTKCAVLRACSGSCHLNICIYTCQDVAATAR